MKETKTELDKVKKKIKHDLARGGVYYMNVKVDKAFELIKQAEKLIEKFQTNMPSELEEAHCILLANKAHILENQGYLTHGFKVANELFTVAEKYDNRRGLSEGHWNLANLYRRSNDFDKAFEHYDLAIALKEGIFNDRAMDDASQKDMGMFWLLQRSLDLSISWTLTSAIQTAVIKNDMERARKYFTRLEELHELKLNEFFITQAYKMGKIYFLSASMRARDRGKAEELCNELIQDKSTVIHYKVGSLHILCKLLFFDLQLTNDSEIVNEIKVLFPKMIKFAQKFGSMAFLVDFLIIQGKLSLITFDFKATRRSFIQARRIAERHGYLLAAAEISRLEEDLEQQLTNWEQLKQNKVPFSERMEVAGITEHLNEGFSSRMTRKELIVESDVTVYKDLHSCMVCKGSAGGFNIYVCPTCKSIYCKTCAKAVIEIENACWTCENPIDESRPSKPFKKEEEALDLEVSEKSEKMSKKPK